ncbi:MAG: hypothetical protein HZB16_04810 [Armatimonadetes bacterium]|nr:hypothetical protein [Armatimonadota bacterium]
MIAAFVFFLVCLVCLIGPIALGDAFPVPWGASVALGGMSFFASLILVWLRLYVKTSANRAFVRTGRGGACCVLDGGRMVIPILHNIVYISLETMKLDVERTGEDALITKDKLRVDVRGEFYIKVDANNDDILAAARSLGERGMHSDAVSELVFEKLVSALRSVAATMDLVEIHSRREEFAKAVFESVREDLKHNGLTLESVTISRLDQTDPSRMSDDNIFDAQGKQKITEITQAAMVERNRLTRDAERQRIAKDVETRQEVLALERQQAETEANQHTEVANIRAAKQREQREFELEQGRAVQEAEITKERSIQQAKVQQEMQVKTAEIERDKQLILREQDRQQTDIARQQQVETARIAQEQAVAVAQRQREISVAEKEAEQAAAERAALEAKAARERANQEVMTVTAVSEADREAQKKLIAAKQVVEQDKIKQQTEAEVLAFAQVKQAEGAQEASQRQADARLKLAEAEAKSKERLAGAEQAERLVEVNVERERVEVEKARVDVERQALENRQTFDRAAIEFEQAKLLIGAMRDVQIEMAKSVAQFMSKGSFQVFGDPTTMSSMMTQFTKGLSLGTLADGMIKNAPEPVRDLMGNLTTSLGPLLERYGLPVPTATAAPAADAEDEGIVGQPPTE